jgi:hypothetical protein
VREFVNSRIVKRYQKFKATLIRLQARPDKGAPRWRFWWLFLWQSLTGRDLLPLSREMADAFVVRGLENIPATGVFTIAVNHTMRRWTPRLLATLHQATLSHRPDLARDWLVIVGYREANIEGRPWWVRRLVKTVRAVYGWLHQRWDYNVLRLPMGNNRNSVEALRDWRERAPRQPAVVFPEGRGKDTFEEIRAGAGRWLAMLGVPVLPVSMWWEATANRWQIVIAPPIEWSEDASLHDLQVGLEIALGLPAEEAPSWQTALAAWENAHTVYSPNPLP